MNYLLFFIVVLISTTLGNLKTIFVSKDNLLIKTVITFVDSILFIFVYKSVLSEQTLELSVVYVVGRCLSIYITDYVSLRLENPVFLVNLYVNKEDTQRLSDYFLENNLSFTFLSGKMDKNKRFYYQLHLNRHQQKELLTFIEDNELSVSMDQHTVKVFGRIKDRV